MTTADPVAPGSAAYWDGRYEAIGETAVSWFEELPETSLDLVDEIADHAAGIVDVGGGASRLVESLLDKGYRDLTVVDLSQHALNAAYQRIGESPVHFVATDIRDWQPDRTFDVWHDRAAYHFLVDPDDQQRYWTLVRASVPVGGHVIIGTFAEDGPQACSGLPVQRYSQAQLEAVMGEGFATRTSVRQHHRTPTGGDQAFLWLLATRV